MSVALAEKMSASLDDRRSRIRELDAIIAGCQVDEDEELRSSFRADTGTRHSATSKVEQIRRKRAKAENEREGLLRDLETLTDEARKAAQVASRELAEKALKRFGECAATEQALLREFKEKLLPLFDWFAETWPRYWADADEQEYQTARLCDQAGLVREFEHVRDQLHGNRPGRDLHNDGKGDRSFLFQADKAVRSIRLSEIQGQARIALENSPYLLFRYTNPEESPAFVVSAPARYVWLDITTAPLVQVDGVGRREWIRKWQAESGLVHEAVTVRRDPPSDAELNEKDPRTGFDRWRRVDEELLG